MVENLGWRDTNTHSYSVYGECCKLGPKCRAYTQPLNVVEYDIVRAV